MGVNVNLGGRSLNVNINKPIEVEVEVEVGGYDIDDLVAAMPSAVDRLLVYAQPTEAEALQDQIGSFNATNNGCTFTPNVGFTGNGTNGYIDLNWGNNLGGSAIHHFMYIPDFGTIENFGNGDSLFGGYDLAGASFSIRISIVSNTRIELIFESSDGFQGAVLSFDPQTGPVYPSFPKDLLLGFNANPSTTDVWINGVKVLSNTNSGITNSRIDFTELALREEGFGPAGHMDSTVSISLGGNTFLTDDEIQTIYSSCKKYLNRNNQTITEGGSFELTNSDASFSQTISADTELSDITITQLDDTTTTAPAAKDLDVDNYLGTGLNVTNSDASYDQDITADLDLPDITITRLDNTTVDVPSVQDIDVDSYLGTVDRIYAIPAPTGQTTSYRTGDDADIETTIFAPARIALPSIGRKVTLTTFNTLNGLNAFGNPQRFTDEIGQQVYGSDYLIDHYTGLGWCLDNSNKTDWNTAIDSALAASNICGLGYSDWFVPNRKQMDSIYNSGTGTLLLSFNGTSLDYHTSTTFANATTDYFYWRDEGRGRILPIGKTFSAYYLHCRKHY